MFTFLIVIDVLLALSIILAVFFHRGPDGFMGDATPTAKNSGPVFETFDKIIAVLVMAFFVVTLGINYIHLYQKEGTAHIDKILEKKTEPSPVTEKKEPEEESQAPLAQ